MTSVNQPAITSCGTRDNSYAFPLTVLTSLFFLWGFITCLNDILIPHLKTVFSLNYTQSMLIQFTFFTAYFVVSLPSGLIVERMGYKRSIVIGLLTAGLGCLMFYPAAGSRSYPIFLSALFVLASGVTLLQVSANPYVAILGRPETASSRLNLTQAFNSLGTTIAPLFGSLMILKVAAQGADELARLPPAKLTAYQAAEAASVQVPYLGLAAAFFLIAALIALVRLPTIEAANPDANPSAVSRPGQYASAWQYRHLLLGAAAIFVYVGGEVAIGSFLVNFMGQPEIAALTPELAGKYLSFYWGGAMVGRFLGSAVLRRVNPGRLLGFNAVVAMALVAAAMLLSGPASMWALLAVGLFNSIMFPTIFTLAVEGLGPHTGQGSGILCMAIVGGAIIPLMQGALADRIGIHHAFLLPLLCYLYIAYYGFKGHLPVLDRT